MSFEASVFLSLLASQPNGGDISTGVRLTNAEYSLALTEGTGAFQANLAWSKSRTATTTNDNLALYALSDTRDGAAVTASFTEVKILYVKNTSATQTLLVGGGVGIGVFSGTPISVAVSIPPGGCYLVAAPSGSGYSVTPNVGTTRFAASAGTCTYDIVLIGEGTIS